MDKVFILTLHMNVIYNFFFLLPFFFNRSNDMLHLCVLHPDRLAVYTLTVTSGQGGHGDSSKLSVAYQHKFQRRAHSITTGKDD